MVLITNCFVGVCVYQTFRITLLCIPRKVKRFDILRIVDLLLKPPEKVIEAPFEVIEETLPPVSDDLIPFYRLIERLGSER